MFGLALGQLQRCQRQGTEEGQRRDGMERESRLGEWTSMGLGLAYGVWMDLGSVHKTFAYKRPVF